MPNLTEILDFAMLGTAIASLIIMIKIKTKKPRDYTEKQKEDLK